MRNGVVVRILMIFAAGLMLAACARTTQTKATTTLDPDYQGGKIHTVLVSVEGAGLAEQKAIETQAALSFQKYGVQTVQGEDLFLPTRRYSDADKRKLAVKSGMDYVLTIVPTDRKIHHVNTPADDDFLYSPRVGVGAYGGSRSGVGVGVGVPIGHWGGADEGGFIGGTQFLEPEQSYRAELSTLPKLERIWIGEFSTRGPDRMSWEKIGSAFAEQLVKQLREDGLL